MPIPRSRVPAPLLLLVGLSIAACLEACSTHSSPPPIETSEGIDDPRAALGYLEATIRRKRHSSEITERDCARKLQEKAIKLKVGAVVIDRIVIKESGIHEGGEIISIKCQGFAIRRSKINRAQPNDTNQFFAQPADRCDLAMASARLRYKPTSIPSRCHSRAIQTRY